jgi:multiple sugar transport system substrate-binding protein
MTRIARRKVLSSAGGLAAILATGRAPAIAQGAANVHWLRWTDFVPASDTLLKGSFTAECKKALGITLKVETVNANDLQARITSAIQSGSGADIIMGFSNWPQLYAESVADASDVAEEIGKAQGGYYDVSKQVATGRQQVDRRAVDLRRRPDVGAQSWFKEVGYDSFPTRSTSFATPARS